MALLGNDKNYIYHRQLKNGEYSIIPNFYWNKFSACWNQHNINCVT